MSATQKLQNFVYHHLVTKFESTSLFTWSNQNKIKVIVIMSLEAK